MRDFRRLFIGNSVSLLGSSVTTVALPLTAVDFLHASPWQMGLLGAVALMPHFVLGLPAGVWVDRFRYRRLLVLADLVQVLLIGAVPVLAAVGALQLWQLYVIVVLAGTCALFEAVAAQSFTPFLVAREKLLPANSALMLGTATVNTTGSALGGVLVTVLAAPMAMVVDATSFLAAALIKAQIGTPGPEPTAKQRERRLGQDILDGLRAVVANPVLRVITVTAAVGALAGQMQNAVLVLYLVQDLKLPPGVVGAAITISGVAGIIGALIVPTVTRRLGTGRAFSAGVAVAAGAGFVLAAATGPVLAFTAQILRGAGPSLYGVNQQALRQTLTPSELLSRVNATWRFLVYGLQPVGALLGGALGTLDLRATLVTGSVLTLGAAGFALRALPS